MEQIYSKHMGSEFFKFEGTIKHSTEMNITLSESYKKMASNSNLTNK